MSVMKIAVAGVIGVFLALQLRDGKAEYGIYLSFAVSLLIFFAMLSRLGGIVELLSVIEKNLTLHVSGFGILLKILGITYIAEFAGGICKDAGYQTVAGQIEVFAKLTVLFLSMPVLTALLETIHAFLS